MRSDFGVGLCTPVLFLAAIQIICLPLVGSGETSPQTPGLCLEDHCACGKKEDCYLWVSLGGCISTQVPRGTWEEVRVSGIGRGSVNIFTGWMAAHQGVPRRSDG